MKKNTRPTPFIHSPHASNLSSNDDNDDMISPNKKMKNRPLFIGPESDLFIALSLTHSRLVNLIDVTLACEGATSKLGNSLLQIWKLSFGHKAKLLFRL